MFFWIYEIPPLLAIAAFGLAFVSVCWLGIFVSRTFVKSRFHQQPGLNGILGTISNISASSTACCWDFLPSGPIKITRRLRRRSQKRPRRLPGSTATSPDIRSHLRPSSGRSSATTHV